MVFLSESSYGKDLVRILRIVRDHATGKHSIIEYDIRCLLSGTQLARSYTHGENNLVVATDSIKNTLNVLAKRLPAADVLCPERFALHAARHFLETYSHVDKAEIDLHTLKWSRIRLPGSAEGHKHSFVRDGHEKRIVHLLAVKNSQGNAVIKDLKGGLRDLLVLKTTASEFNGFWRDEYTTLKEVNDRVFSTAIDCQYTIGLPAEPISSILQSSQPSFCSLFAAVRGHTLRIFADTPSASVQATLYQMCEAALNDRDSKTFCSLLEDVEYALPNKHYIPIDLGFVGLKNVKEEDAEVFLPSAHPSGLIRAKVSRHAPKL